MRVSRSALLLPRAAPPKCTHDKGRERHEKSTYGRTSSLLASVPGLSGTTTRNSNLRGSAEVDILLTCCCCCCVLGSASPAPVAEAERMPLLAAAAAVVVLRVADGVCSPGATMVLASRLRRAAMSRGESNS